MRHLLPQRRHHHRFEVQRHPAQLDVDGVVRADGPLDQRRPDEPKLQHFANPGDNGIVAVAVARGTGARSFDGDRHTGQGSALLTRDFTGDGLLLRNGLSSDKEHSQQHHDDGSFHK